MYQWNEVHKIFLLLQKKSPVNLRYAAVILTPLQLRRSLIQNGFCPCARPYKWNQVWQDCKINLEARCFVV